MTVDRSVAVVLDRKDELSIETEDEGLGVGSIVASAVPVDRSISATDSAIVCAEQGDRGAFVIATGMEVDVLPPVAAGEVQQGSCIRDTIQQLPKVVDLRDVCYRFCVPKTGS